MAVDRDHPELTHAWLIADGLADLGALGANGLVERVDVVDLEVSEVGMIAEFGRRRRIRAQPGPDRALAGGVKEKTGIWNGVNRKSQHVAIKSGGLLEIMHRDDESSLQDFRHTGIVYAEFFMKSEPP